MNAAEATMLRKARRERAPLEGSRGSPNPEDRSDGGRESRGGGRQHGAPKQARRASSCIHAAASGKSAKLKRAAREEDIRRQADAAAQAAMQERMSVLAEEKAAAEAKAALAERQVQTHEAQLYEQREAARKGKGRRGERRKERPRSRSELKLQTKFEELESDAYEKKTDGGARRRRGDRSLRGAQGTNFRATGSSVSRKGSPAPTSCIPSSITARNAGRSSTTPRTTMLGATIL